MLNTKWFVLVKDTALVYGSSLQVVFSASKYSFPIDIRAFCISILQFI